MEMLHDKLQEWEVIWAALCSVCNATLLQDKLQQFVDNKNILFSHSVQQYFAQIFHGNLYTCCYTCWE